MCYVVSDYWLCTVRWDAKNAKYKYITYHSSVQRIVQYCCNEDEDGDHYESYQCSVDYSRYRLRGFKDSCISHEQTCGN
jgi:hypothetical protein